MCIDFPTDGGLCWSPLRDWTRAPHADGRMVWVVERRVYALHRTSFAPMADCMVFAGGERAKCWTNVLRMIRAWLMMGLCREDALVLVGGGAFLDTAAFAAATFARGAVPFALVPTTLLAMVDAAVGGKNGINTHHAKNTIGCICQPHGLGYELDFLRTLPQRRFAEAFAEIIKYGAVADAALLAELETHRLRDYKASMPLLKALIQRCVQLKMGMVSRDVADTKGFRRVLNFGHTLGHALERVSGCSHGVAVAQGMRFACWLACRHKTGLQKNAQTRLDALLRRYQLPVHVKPEWPSVSTLLNTMSADKKRRAKTLEWVLIADWGKPVLRPLSWAAVETALGEFVQEENEGLRA